MRSPVSFSSTSSAPQVVAGDVIAGKYRVERILGRGGMGIVVAARHLQLDQLVAIKLLLPEADGDEVAVERLMNEARAVAKLRSEHVARVIDIGRLPGSGPYMVMEYLDGADLGEVLELEGPFAPEVASDYIVQACDAIAEAHARGIVHRDLKPENLYLTTRLGGAWMVKVIDFGISKTLTGHRGGLTQTRTVLGSPLYMAPEQLRSARQASPRSDVYALGVVLFELLTRRWPFEAESLPDLCLKITREPPRPLGDFRIGVPPALVEVVARCLEKEPQARYADAAALSVALQPFLSPSSREREMAGGTRSIVHSLAETQAAPAADAATLPLPTPAARRTWVALALAGTLVAASSLVLSGAGSRPAPMALAAVEAALTSATGAHTFVVPTVGPVPAPMVRSTAASAPTPTPRPYRPSRVVAHPRPAAPSTPDDDIPAFR